MRSRVRDAAGRAITVNDPSRIVSVGGAVTEILYALGLEARVVAVDTTSLFPPRALREKPNVGYMRQLSPEGVLGLAPSLILASESAGPKATLRVLEAAAIPFVRVPDHFTGEGIVEKISHHRAGNRGCRARRLSCGIGGGRSRRACRVAQAHRRAGAGAVRIVLRERPADGRRPRHRRRRHHPAGRRAPMRSPISRATRSSTTKRSSRPSPTPCS